MLKILRDEVLHSGLAKAVGKVSIKELDEELSRFADETSLRLLASAGLRGELMMCVPCLLKQSPKLLGYYRLLLGFSQKEFYGSAFQTSAFKSLETKGILTAKQEQNLGRLCAALNASSSALLTSLGKKDLSGRHLENLALLTLGPQLRGGSNVRKGSRGIVAVFEILHEIVKDGLVDEKPSELVVENTSGRRVHIAFAPDPDIVITESYDKNSYRNIVAIEVKSGTDFSNIHNRIGEAEKSHQKARTRKFVECWTIVNIDKLDFDKAGNESPSTDKFYRINSLLDKSSAEFRDFRYRIQSLVGLPSK